MATILLGIAVTVIDGTVANLALPGMVRDLHTHASDAVWIVNAYQLATLVLLLPLASLGDRLGYRRIYLVGVVLFTLASGLCSMASSLPTLAVARALQGMGAAGIMSVNPALVRLTYPPSQLGRGIALNSMVVATASVAGPVLAAAILSVAGWPWLFLVNVPLGVLLFLLGQRVLPANTLFTGPLRFSPLDIVLNGAMFVLLFVGADLLGGMGRGGEGGMGASPAWGLGLLAACAAVGTVHVLRQRRLAHPLLPIDLLRIPVFRLSMATSVCAFAAQTMAYVALPFLFLDAWHHSPGQAGLLMACWPLGVIAAASVTGRLIGRFHGGLLGAIGLGVLALGLGLMGLAAASSAATEPAVWWRLAVCGLGFGLFQSPNNHTIITSAPAHRAGAASGMLGTARLTGQSLGAALLAAVFALASAHDGGGAQAALALSAGLAAAAAVFSGLRLRTTQA
ncbi:MULTISPECIES: MFS transporter [Ramlibacter]|uniref:MFS transporter n=1 Tax=Ramlibacter aquaticus TaxID=2780094 RepID=A0ABR9SHA1_9BURK|nr:MULTISPECIES: MFS transporter [Ramlibacter]MBE7941102.1 MFS transporter [Ramlibacter aquaticus]